MHPGVTLTNQLWREVMGFQVSKKKPNPERFRRRIGDTPVLGPGK